MSKLSRRALLKWGLGAAQLALLERAGLLDLGRARASTTDVPSRILVFYIPGGYRPHYAFWPMDDAQIIETVPDPTDYSGEPVFFRADRMIDLAPANGAYKPLRTWRSWDPTDPSKRGNGFSPAMYGYSHFALHENLSVLHGIDQGTNDHQSGFIASMCGVAGADYRAPSVHSVVANHLYARTKETRPLPFVVVTAERGSPTAMGMPSHAAPTQVPSLDALRPQLSDDPTSNRWWTGLNDRTLRPELDVRGAPTGSQLGTTRLEQLTLDRVGRYLGRSAPKVDAYLENLHGSLASVSRVLATDVVSMLGATPGITHLVDDRPAYLSSYFDNPFAYSFGLANFHMTQLEPRMDMAMRLLKSDLTSAIHVSLGASLDFDTHNGSGHAFSCAHGRNLLDCVARFLGEMKNTPAPNTTGKSLLDDTLVLVMSEFGRSFAYRSGGTYYPPDDHHPFTSVMFAGGNVAPNRQIGSYTNGGIGLPVDIVEEDGRSTRRVPRAADVVTTALRIMGLDMHDFFIPGGFGEVLGMRRA
jgi:hypothetical protein